MKNWTLYFFVIISFLQINAQNLLVNPGFETWSNGRPTGWSVSNAVYASENKSIFIEGTKSFNANTEQVNSTVSLTQNIAITAGKTYNLKVSYYVQRGDGTDAKLLCYFKNSLNKAIPLSLEDSLLLKGPGGNSSFFPTELGVWKTYTCNIVAPVGASIFVFSVRSVAYSNVLWDNFSFSVNTTPTVTISKSSLSGFSYVPGSGPSPEDNFTVKGSNLTGPITLTAPTNYEISTTSGSSFSAKQSISLTPSNGIVNTTTIFVRLKANLSANTYTGNLTVQATGVALQNIALSGSVGSAPVIVNTSVSSLSGFSYSEDAGPSSIKSFTLSGSGLSNGITVSAPSGYEISIFGGTYFIGSNTFTITQSNGTVSLTTIYVRLKAGLNADTYTGNITLTTNGLSPKTISLSGAVNSVPVITTSTNSLSGFRYEPGNGPSPTQSFTVSATGMLTALIISAPSNYEISTESGTGFSGSSQLVLSQSGGEINATTIYIRLKSGLSEAVYNGTLSLQTGGGITKNISISGVVSLPLALNVSKTNISGLGYVTNQGPSEQQSFTVSAQGLSTMLVISAPQNFEISTEGGNLFSGNDQIILPINSGNVALTTIYVRLKAGLDISDSYAGNIIIYSGPDISHFIFMSGYVSPLSNISVSTNELTDFSYITGAGPSSDQSFTVSAAGLSAKLTITAPTGYELSILNGENFNGINIMEFSPSNGNIPTTTLYVRLKSGLPVATYTGNISITSDNTISKNISLSGNVLLSTDNNYSMENTVRIATSDNCITISGLIKMQRVDLYSLTGAIVKHILSDSDNLKMEVPCKGIYILRIDNKAFKISL